MFGASGVGLEQESSTLTWRLQAFRSHGLQLLSAVGDPRNTDP